MGNSEGKKEKKASLKGFLDSGLNSKDLAKTLSSGNSKSIVSAISFIEKNVTRRFKSGKKKALEKVKTKRDRKKKFDTRAFTSTITREQFKMKENEEGVVETEFKFEGLPLINDTYLIVKELGKGAFGAVLLIRDVKTKVMYAMKTIPLGGKGEMEKRVLESAKTELEILPSLKHENIIRYITHFTVDHDPTTAEKKEKGKKKDNFLCIIMEYVKGSDLDYLLKFSESNDYDISPCVTIKWFIVLLKAINHIHKSGIIHRDLKPDNILVSYDKIESQDSMKLVIADFGVGKDVGQSGLGETLAGHIFYLSPEILAGGKYGKKVDCWSLALIFFQVYFGVSTDSFEKNIQQMMKLVKDDEELNKHFCEVYNKKDIFTDVTFIDLMKYMATHGLIFDKMIKNLCTEDKAIGVILKRMVTGEENRLESSELLATNIVKTWEFLVCPSSEKVKDFSFLDVDALFTIINAVKDEKKVLNQCFKALMKIIKDEKKLKYFLKCDGIGILSGRMLFFEDDSSVLGNYFIFLLNVIKQKMEEIEKIIVILREFSLIDILKREVLNFNISVVFFALLVMMHNNTICSYFRDIVFPMFQKACKEKEAGGRKQLYTYFVQTLLRNIDQSAFLQKSLEMIDKNDLLFLKYYDLKKVEDDEVIDQILHRVVSRLDELLKLDSKSVEDSLKENLLMLLFFVGSKQKGGGTFELRNNLSDNLNSLVPEEDQAESSSFEMIDTCEFQCVSADKDEKAILSSDCPTGTFNLQKKTKKSRSKKSKFESRSESSSSSSVFSDVAGNRKQYVAAYYEIFVLDGGSNERLDFGIYVNEETMYYLSNGVVYKKDAKSGKKRVIKKLSSSIKFYSYSTVGCAVTTGGKMFFTKNGDQIPEMIDLGLDFTEEYQVNAYLNVSGNEYLYCSINFDSPFEYQFSNIRVRYDSLMVGNKGLQEVVNKIKKVKKLADEKKFAVLSKLCDEFTVLASDSVKKKIVKKKTTALYRFNPSLILKNLGKLNKKFLLSAK